MNELIFFTGTNKYTVSLVHITKYMNQEQRPKMTDNKVMVLEQSWSNCIAGG